MIISLVIAMDESNAIGFDGKLPWHLPADLKKFKSITMGHHIIMGRKTFESIAKPLPGRTNVVVSRQAAYHPPGTIVVPSLADAFVFARSKEENEAFVIGGAQLAKDAMPFLDKIYLTRIHHTFGADTYFPVIDMSEWEIVNEEEHLPDEKNHYAFTFQEMERKKK